MAEKIKVLSNGKEIFYRSKSTIVLPKKISQTEQLLSFNNKILHPEDKLARKPIISWVEDINTSLKAINTLKDLIEEAEKIALIYNQSTYIMAVVGDFKSAYRFCYAAISLFNNIFIQSGKAEYLFYSIQPWINLIRLDRMLMKKDDALNKLRLLISNNFSQAPTNYESIISSVFSQNPTSNLLEIINNAYVMETLKIFLQEKNYKGILDLKQRANLNGFHLSLIAESEVIALNQLKEFDKSFCMALDQYENGQPIAMPVFLYRMMELVSKEQLKHYSLADTMIHYIQRKLKTNNYSLYDLMFMFEVYKYIFFHLEEYRDIDLIELFSHCFFKKNDEPGRIDSLRLASLLDKRNTKALNNLINNSCYSFINKKNSYAITDGPSYKLMLQRLEFHLSFIRN